jgi:hypothetical protein
MTTDQPRGDSRSGQCLTRQHERCAYPPCPCPCHRKEGFRGSNPLG